MNTAREETPDVPARRAAEVRTTLLHLLRLVVIELARRLVVPDGDIELNDGPPKDRSRPSG